LMQAVEQVPYAHLWVAGDGYLSEPLKAAAERPPLEHRVKFWGWVGQERLAALYEACDVVVVPSLWPEPFGLVGVEAMLHGKPVVAFQVGAVGEWLVDGETGYQVPPGDVKALAERIMRLLAHPDEAHRMGQRGKEIALQRFAPEGYVAAVLSVYQELQRNPRRGER